MTQPLISDLDAKAANATTFKVSMTELELQFMIFQMEASLDACLKAAGEDIVEDGHYQGLERILTKFRKAYPIWKV